MDIKKCYATYVAYKKRQCVVDESLVVLSEVIKDSPDIESAFLSASFAVCESLSIELRQSELDQVLKDIEYKFFNKIYRNSFESVIHESNARIQRDISSLPWYLSVLPNRVKVRLCVAKIFRTVCHFVEEKQDDNSCTEETLLRCGYLYSIHKGLESGKI
ncbi:TPA: hypothetical protein I7730_01285 [Vibrio vulnificus]|uniref:Uncharacterized protein n=1 Tax=Vibrio vulnificus TaxID=672 RepID=A0A8H9K5F0_VIBVL|nr:hypothetical protein [Vibrio vulnificus]